MTERQSMPRVLKQIVFGYAIDFFPGLLIVGYQQLKRKIARSGFDVTVSMNPLSDLPLETDILLVPEQLLDEARRVASTSQVEPLDNFLNHPLYNVLVRQLVEGNVWTAPKLAAPSESDEEGEIRTYRGYERIE